MADQSELEATVAAARATPERLPLWDRLEAMAAELDRPDEVAALYRETLRRDLDRELLLALGERAAQFYQEWFSDDPSRLIEALVRILELDPELHTAFQRLTVAYTVAERWDELLAVYDRALEATSDRARRMKLLDEAAQVAKDVAHRGDKAIDYLLELRTLSPEDGKIVQVLERLLERSERWPDLIRLWESQLDDLPKAERERIRTRIAACWVDQLRDPGRALAAIKPLLAEAENATEACALLERILLAAKTEPAVREGALELLRAHHDVADRPRQLVRILTAALPIAAAAGDRATEANLHREAAGRLADLNEGALAMDHYAALLVLDPMSVVTQDQMRQLADRTHGYGRYAEGVAAAAAHCGDVSRRIALLAEAAATRLERLDDPGGAIELYKLALAQEGIAAADLRQVARRLSELLAAADRGPEQLEVLERLAQVESPPLRQRLAWGDVARLATSLGETQRAIVAWRRRLEQSPEDRVARDALIELLEAGRDDDSLIEALEQRVAGSDSSRQRQADLTRIATLWARQDRDPTRAIASWQRVQSEAGDTPESIDALSEVYARTERWDDLIALLDRVSEKENQRVAARLVRLGDACRRHRSDAPAALSSYRKALALDPENEGAFAGLAALLELDDCRGAALAVLADRCRQVGDFAGLVDLVDARLALARSDLERAAILAEAAAVSEDHLGEPSAALTLQARAFALAPKDRAVEERLTQLAGATGEWARAAAAYGEAARALAGEPHRAARLHLGQAAILEREVGDAPGALAAYLACLAADESNRPAAEGAVRVGVSQERWNDVARALVCASAAAADVDEVLAGQAHRAARDRAAVTDLARALASEVAAALGAATPPPRRTAQRLYERIAAWHLSEKGGAEAARAALEAALQVGGDRVETLRALAALQAQTGAPERGDTIARLAALEPGDLDLAREAAHELRGSGDQERRALEELLARATAAWRRAEGANPAPLPGREHAALAIERLVELHRASGRAVEAVDLLTASARLPFADDVRLTLRRRAAAIASQDLGDRRLAVEMLRALLALAPDDGPTLDQLAELYGASGQWAELLTVRRHQLGRERDRARRLELRLEVARLVGEIERLGDRLGSLRDNLEECPGHEASLAALTDLLLQRGWHGQLADLLAAQAAKLEALGERARAAELWARVAELAEVHLGDGARAIEAHRRVVDLAPTRAALGALARRYLQRQEPARAIPWLERVFRLAEESERPAAVEALARAHLAAGQRGQAIASLEGYLGQGGPGLGLRTLLADLYRDAGAWEPLARLLTQSLALVEDEHLAADFAREAADIYSDRLGRPDQAIPALEHAMALRPGDRGLQAKLATGLRVAGRCEEARAQLGDLIASFGRRRSPERAAAHVELARVADAQGNPTEALEELETAARMDSGNPQMLKMLGDLARRVGRLDDAERTYRALLLVVRRQPPDADESQLGVSEVLFELHKVAEARGDSEQARALCQDALEVGAESDVEVRRLRRSLLAHGDGELLVRALTTRLQATSDPAGQASLLADLAQVYAGSLGRGEQALEAQLRAIDLAPARLELQDAARAMAREAGQVGRYIESVAAAVDKLRRQSDAVAVAGLLLRGAAALEEDLGDLDGALEMYRQAEATGALLPQCYFAIARVAGARPDEAEKTRALAALAALAAASPPQPSPDHIDAVYRIAELFVATDERRQEGLRLLHRAFDAAPQLRRAGAILRQAAAAEPGNQEVLALYERVARGSGDWEMMLDFLERRAQLPQASAAQIHEAAAFAVEHGAPARGEELLVAVVVRARGGEDGIAAAAWAVEALAELYSRSGRLQQARDLFFEMAEVAAAEKTVEVGLAIAGAAARRPGHEELAAEIYEHLRALDPGARAIWEPLIHLYRNTGAHERLHQTVAATLPRLVDPRERNALRLEHAAHLVNALERYGDAVEILRDILLDDPEHLDAARLLEDVFCRTGNQEALADFLWQSFERARQQGVPERIEEVALRLGSVLEAMKSAEAIAVYRAALEDAPASRDLLRGVLDHVEEDVNPRERAGLMERLLLVEDPGQAGRLALDLAELWNSLADDGGVQRALEAGHRLRPDDATLRARLEAWYRERSMWRPLADLLVGDAERAAADSELFVARLRQAAAIYDRELGEPAAAAALLARARHAAPADAALLAELTTFLVAAGDVRAAVATIDAALADLEERDARVRLLTARSDLRMQLGEGAAAVADLEAAYELQPEAVADKLCSALERHRWACGDRGDRGGERAATLRLADLLARGGMVQESRELIASWVAREPGDREALCRLRDIDAAREDWQGVIEACSQLLLLEEGQPQIEAALGLAEASERADRPALAREGLERVHLAQPESAVIRDRLRRIYELSRAHRELAALLLQDAEHSDGSDARYECYRRAADLLVRELGDPEAALEPAAKARALRPGDDAAAALYVDVLTAAGRIDEAEAILQPAIAAYKRRSPQLALLQQRMARAAAARGDRQGQVTWLKKAFDVDRKNGEIAAELAQLATEMGEYELALKPLRALTLMEDPSPVSRVMALLWEAKIEHARGNHAKAELWAKKALREDPNFSEARDFLAQISQ